MLMVTLLYFLFAVNLFHIFSQNGLQFYKSGRFWVIIVPLGILIWATVFS